jgi:hypothetical protein
MGLNRQAASGRLVTGGPEKKDESNENQTICNFTVVRIAGRVQQSDNRPRGELTNTSADTGDL